MDFMNGNAFHPIPQQRVRERVDALMARRDYPGVERHLRYWLEEARMGRDERGELMVLNELVGHYRKTAERDKALACARQALELLDKLDFRGSISEGTTCINIATALNAFSENAWALELFQRARGIYEASPAIEPGQIGGLYNNMALTCAGLGRYDEAMSLYQQALEQMKQAQNGELEQAVTCLNICNLVEAVQGPEAGEKAICEWLDRAAELLRDTDAPRDGYYAFVCEKCAPTFDYYGYFAEAATLTREAKRIYEGD